MALWALAIVAILLAIAVRTDRTELRETQNVVGLSRARLAAEAGAELGLARLLRHRAAGTTTFDGLPEPWDDDGTPVEIAIVDEAGKIDLNQAPLELLAGLFAAVGRPRDDATVLACNVLEWRGDVGTSCPPRRDGTPPQPHLFLVPEELAQVPAAGGDLYDAVADYVTVATKSTAIDPFAAQRPVLLAIPGATPEMVDAYLDERARWHDLAASPAATEMFRSVAAIMTSPARDFTISATATVGGRLRYRSDLQVRLTGSPNRPYEIVATRAPPPGRGVAVAPPARRIP